MKKDRKTYEQSHAHMRKRRKGRRRTGIDWEYNGDGQFFRERIKGYFKRYWRKWLKREQESQLKNSHFSKS